MSNFTFDRVVRGAHEGEVVIPVLRAMLWNPRFASIPIRVPDFKPRPPDGYFHPSTHPLMPPRMLYYYLAEPDRLIDEPFDPHSTMAVTQGTFWHDFIQHIGLQAGILRPPPTAKCPCGCDTKVEWYFRDEATKSRGHADGVVDPTDEIFEFKTMRPSKFRKLVKGRPDDPEVLASWLQMTPGYVAQGQEYMRIGGFRSHRTVVLSMEYPFEMREIVMPYDHEFAFRTEQKYRRVLQAAADKDTSIEACCTPRSALARECPARNICPVGLLG